MVADIEIRAQRRLSEMLKKGIDTTLEAVIQNLKERDHIDSSREEGPLKQAEDAILLDTSSMTIEDQVESVYKLAMERIIA